MNNIKSDSNGFPLVSIIIPVFNGSNFMKEAIDSALNQTYKNCEVIVVNDGSSDDGKTRSIALSYGNSIRYYEKENGGVASALNLGIAEMAGEFFSWLSHDDVYYPQKIEKSISFMNKLKELNAIIYSDWENIDENSKYLRTRKIRHVKPEIFQRLLIIDHPVNGNTVLIPKSIFREIGLFDETLKTTQDYNMWHRMSFKYPFYHLQIPLVKNRDHKNQGTITIPGFISESNSTKVNYLSRFSDTDLKKLFNENSITKLYVKLIINFSLRGGSAGGMPTKYLFERMIKSDEYCSNTKYFVLSNLVKLFEWRFSRKTMKNIFQYLNVSKFNLDK